MITVLLLVTSSFTSNTGSLQYYKGTIGNNSKIQMSLELKGTLMYGSFIYEESGEVFVLNGRIGESSQSVILNVLNDNNTNIAKIQGHYYTNDLDEITSIKGAYIDLKTNQRQKLNLEKVAEFIARGDSHSDRF